VLHVYERCEHADCPVCTYLSSIDPTLVLGQYDLEIEGSWYGRLLVEIPVDASLEGELLTVAYCKNGRLMTIQVRVKDGYIRFWTDGLYAFTILDGVYTVAQAPDGSQILVDEMGIGIKTVAGLQGVSIAVELPVPGNSTPEAVETVLISLPTLPVCDPRKQALITA